MVHRHKTTEEALPARIERKRATPVLWLLHTPGRGVVVEPGCTLTPGRHLVGRETDGDDGIVLDDPRASRLHATLHVASRSQRVRIRDEGSRNGTFVNGVRVEEQWLEDGDRVRLADTHLLLRMVPPDLGDVEIDGLLGRSAAVCTLRATIAQVAPHPVNVLLLGASGTGKEAAARAVHVCSGRRGAFVPINCAAIPEPLAESQLFGHVAGAFTGAHTDQRGLFRAADGGTLFLDEIGDLGAGLQPKLLRALEEGAVVPVGASSPVRCDVRIVAATNRDLAPAAGSVFRGDLFARLSELSIALPRLSERREDILLLLRHGFGEGMPPLAPELVEALLGYAWPFNVREVMAVGRELFVKGRGTAPLALELVAHRLAGAPSTAIGSAGGALDGRGIATPGFATGSGAGTGSGVGTGSGAGMAFGTGATPDGRGTPPSREELERILHECKGNVRRIAHATGRSRMQVYRWVEQYGLELERYRDK